MNSLNSSPTQFQVNLRRLTYILAGLAVSSCIVRNDYNVVFAFLILALINKYYADEPEYYSKILFHIVAALIIVDIIWIAITMPYWSTSSKTHSEYWDSLSTVHTIAIILAFVQIAVKALMGYLIFSNFKVQFKDAGKLFNLNYEAHPEISK